MHGHFIIIVLDFMLALLVKPFRQRLYFPPHQTHSLIHTPCELVLLCFYTMWCAGGSEQNTKIASRLIKYSALLNMYASTRTAAPWYIYIVYKYIFNI